MKTDENVKNVRTVVRTDCSLGIRTIAEEVNMDKEAVRHFNSASKHEKSVCQNGPKEPASF
jgi:hypothetical protein